MRSIACLLTLLVTLTLQNCLSRKKDQSTLLLRIGLQKSPSNALIILTKLKGYYDSTRINVELVPFEAGKLAYQELSSNASSLDLAIAAETPFVLSVLNSSPDVVVIGSVVKATNEARLVVADDGSATSVNSFFATKPRKIATSLGGSPEYTYWRLIRDYKLDSTRIEKVGMKPSEMPAAVGNGIDGVVVFDPPAFKAAEKLGNRSRTFVDRLPVLTFYNIYTAKKTISAKQEAVEIFLSGILKTQSWVKNNPAEAQQLIANYTGIDVKIVAATWPSYQFGLLPPSKALRELCDDQVAWAKATGKSVASKPDFNSYFDSKPFQLAYSKEVVKAN